MTKLFLAAVSALVLSGEALARSQELRVWRGETAAVRIADMIELGESPAGLTLKFGRLKAVKAAPQPNSLKRDEYLDRVEWLKGPQGAQLVMVSAPLSATSGVYRCGMLQIEVLDRVLPPPSEWQYHLDLWQHPWAAARYHRVSPFTAAHYAAMRPILETLAAAGQKVITTTMVDQPWNHQCFDAYHSMIDRVKKDDGSWVFDFARFDEYVRFARACGIGPDIALYTMCPWEYVVRWRNERGELCSAVAKPGSAEFEDFWGEFLKEFSRHLRQLGWLDNAYLAMDERSPEDVKAIIDFVRVKAPGFKISMAGNRNPADFKGLTIDSYSQLLSEMDEAFLSEVTRRRAAGLKTTLYVCCVPSHPNTVFAPASEIEEAFWLGAYPCFAGFDGFLRWAANSWPEDPLGDATFGPWPAGDTFLIYPDGSPSYRFLELRAGVVAAEKLRRLLLSEREATLKKMTELAELFDFKKASGGEVDWRKAKERLEAAVNFVL